MACCFCFANCVGTMFPLRGLQSTILMYFLSGNFTTFLKQHHNFPHSTHKLHVSWLFMELIIYIELKAISCVLWAAAYNQCLLLLLECSSLSINTFKWIIEWSSLELQTIEQIKSMNIAANNLNANARMTSNISILWHQQLKLISHDCWFRIHSITFFIFRHNIQRHCLLPTSKLNNFIVYRFCSDF